MKKMKKLLILIVFVGLLAISVEIAFQNLKNNALVTVDNPAVTGLQLTPSSFKGTLNLIVNNPTNISFTLVSLTGDIKATTGGAVLGQFAAPANIIINSGTNKIPVNIAVGGIDAAILFVGSNNITIDGVGQGKKGFITFPIPAFTESFTISGLISGHIDNNVNNTAKIS